MVLWDIIRDFFVQFIFGGIDSLGEIYGGVVCSTYVSEPGIGDLPPIEEYQPLYGEEFSFNIGDYQVSLGDWLSTTATIICLIGFCFIIYCFIRYLFRLSAGLVRGH